MASVLVVSAHLPYPPRWGFGTRVYQLMRQIASRHDATLLCYAAPGDENVERLRQEFPVEAVERERTGVAAKRFDQLRSLGSKAPYDSRSVYSRELQRALDSLFAERGFDIVQLESALLTLFEIPRTARLVLDEHNLEYEVYGRLREAERSTLRREFYRLEERRMRRFEERAWQRAAGCVTTSEREAEIIRPLAPDTPVAVVPNGVDIDYFRPPAEPSVEPGMLVFNGVLDYRPNVDAVNFLVDEVLPLIRTERPEVRLAVVGRGSAGALDDLRRRGVEATGEVPDVRPWLARAEVVVVPIRTGSGTRLKVVEGLAMGKPMVSTTVGCEGVDVRNDEHLLIGDSAQEFAKKVLRLFEEPALGGQLGRAGRELMEREYSWDRAGELLESLYERVAGPHRPASQSTLAS
jgi:glycosyltransferase involved in cell wall biosynthesis